MGRFIQKQKQTITPSLAYQPKKTTVKTTELEFVEEKTKTTTIEELAESIVKSEKNKKKIKQKKVMTTAEKINAAQDILSAPQVKKIKKEKGLLERTESSCTIITEDNKELLMD